MLEIPVFDGVVCFLWTVAGVTDVQLRSQFDASCSNLLQNFRSLSAIAGLALAVIFSWKLLRPPSGHRRRQPKRQTSSAGNSDISTSSNSQLITSAVFSPSDDAGAQKVSCGLGKIHLLYL